MSVLRMVAADVKIAHSVFALPFAILASVMAAAPDNAAPIDWSVFGGQLGLIVLAMVFARTAAMLANRVVDAEIDGRNPRTAGRAIPSGRLSRSAALAVLITCALLFLATCAGFGVWFGNWWPALLGGPVLAWLGAYPFLKRYTTLCHFYLGSTLAISPLAAALAVDPSSLARQPALWLLAAMVFGWVSGFDVIYALQDIAVDRREGLFSIPSRLGAAAGLRISRGLHATAALCLIAAWVVDARLSFVFAIGVVTVIVLLACEHATVARWGASRIALAFFTLNGLISCVLGLLGAIDVMFV